MSFPNENGGSFHSYVNVYQRVSDLDGDIHGDISGKNNQSWMPKSYGDHHRISILVEYVLSSGCGYCRSQHIWDVMEFSMRCHGLIMGYTGIYTYIYMGIYIYIQIYIYIYTHTHIYIYIIVLQFQSFFKSSWIFCVSACVCACWRP